MGETDEARAAGPDAAAVGHENVHFEERIDLRPGATQSLVVGIIVLFVLGGMALAVAKFGLLSPPGLLVAFGVVVLALLGYSWFDTALSELHVRVTDAGVEVRQENRLLSGRSTELTVPFEDVSAVQYDDREPVVLAKAGETNTRFNVARENSKSQTSWEYCDDGVRIERPDGSAVYVGSRRPVELAEAIANRAPAVDGVEEIPQDRARPVMG